MAQAAPPLIRVINQPNPPTAAAQSLLPLLTPLPLQGRAGQGHGGVGGGGGFTPIIDPSSQDEFEALQGLIEMGSRPTSHAGRLT